MIDKFNIKGMKAIVTGGTRGIGRAITIRFARAGAAVIANYVRNEDAAQELLSFCQDEKLNVITCRADLTGKKGIDKLVASASDQFGVERLNTLVNCAATGIHKLFTDLTLRHFDWTFQLNVRAFFNLTQSLLPLFAPESSIVVVSSLGAKRAMKTYSLVGASKGALEALARHLALELSPKGIRVNILCPGTVKTDAWKVIPNSEKRLSRAAEKTVTGNLVTPEEVSYCAQFLCSDAGSGMVGHTLVVDNGESLSM